VRQEARGLFMHLACVSGRCKQQVFIGILAISAGNANRYQGLLTGGTFVETRVITKVFRSDPPYRIPKPFMI
jgi:hypothetical protein